MNVPPTKESGIALSADPRVNFSDREIAWEKVLRAIVMSSDLKMPSEGFGMVARKALADGGVPYDGPNYAAPRDHAD